MNNNVNIQIPLAATLKTDKDAPFGIIMSFIGPGNGSPMATNVVLVVVLVVGVVVIRFSIL